jgi:phenylacetate-coenzyme A ligase PaaK-like adenylate-forming protein
MLQLATEAHSNESFNYIDLPDPRSHVDNIFPLTNHILYGNVASFSEAPCLMPADLADYTSRCELQTGVTNLEICPACFFNTSGTTSRSKHIPYSDADLNRQRLHEAIALRKLGLHAGDGVISLGSPLPSISGWAIVNGSKAVGASVLNSSQLDFEQALSEENRYKVTVVIGTPMVVREIGLAIEEEHGTLHKIFPNLRMAILFGDVLPTAMRVKIARIWGNLAIYSLYGTVEADVVATESLGAPGLMHLMDERLIFELIPEAELWKEREIPSYMPRLYDLNEAAEGTIGEIIISDLSREVLPLIRYRIGDIVRVHGADPAHPQLGLRISVLGRSKNTVLIVGIPLYEMQITAALEQSIGSQLADWRLIQQKSEDAAVFRYCLYIELPGGETLSVSDVKRVLATLGAQRAEFANIDIASYIEVIATKKLEQDAPQGDAKARRIVLA